MRSVLAFIIPLMLLLGPLGTYAAPDGGAVVLSSMRINVEPRQRTAEVILTNRTTVEQRYRVSIIDMVMDAHGNTAISENETDSHDQGASHWVIATPTSVQLGPGESQNIRLLIRRPKDLQDGEYRTHLSVAQQPSTDIAGGLQETAQEGGLQFKIVTVYSTNIPVMIKQGNVNAGASLVKADLVDMGKRVMLTVDRSGNGSFRGFVQMKAGNATPINMPIVIYPERNQVKVSRDMGTLINSVGPITLSLYKGLLPKEGEAMMPTEILDTFILTR